MIKANELRIGNIIRFSNLIEPAKDITVTARFFTALAGGRPFSELKPDEEINGYYSGIPLTPEILEACGFEITKADAYNITHAYNGYLNINTYTENGEYWWLRYFQGGTNAKLKYLHQFQNLYFAITGKELEYKPVVAVMGY